MEFLHLHFYELIKLCFEFLAIGLIKPRYQFEAECIYNAINGVGTNHKVNTDRDNLLTNF